MKNLYFAASLAVFTASTPQTAAITNIFVIRDGAIWPTGHPDTPTTPIPPPTNRPPTTGIVYTNGALWPTGFPGETRPASPPGSINEPPLAATNRPSTVVNFLRALPSDIPYRGNIAVEWQTDRNPFTTLGDRVVMVHDGAPEEDIETKTIVLRGGNAFFRASDPGVIRFYYLQPLYERVLTSNPVTVRPFTPDLSLVRNATNAGSTIIIAGDSVALGDTNGVSLVSIIAPKTNLRVVNAGKAGDTTRSLLARYQSDVLAHNPKVVVLIIGGNDERVLAGASISRTESLGNIRAIIDKTYAKGASVLFLGTADFEPLLASQYRAIATETRAAYIPDIMEDLWLDPRFMRDALHPNARGYARIERRVGPAILALGGTSSAGPSVIPVPTGDQDFEFTWTMTASRVGININWHATAGKWYRIIASDDLSRTPAQWKTVSRAKAETSGPLTVTVRTDGQPMQFLRLMEE